MPAPDGVGLVGDPWEGFRWREHRDKIRVLQVTRWSGRPYPAVVRAENIAEEYPVVTRDSDALLAARLLAEHRLPGLVVTDQGRPCCVLPASQVVRFLVPAYVQDDPALARVLDESMADHIADSLDGKTVGALLPRETPELAVVNADDTIIEVAAVMARLKCPLAVVMDGDRLVGVITASRLLQVALH